MTKHALSMQDAILKLQEYWAGVGCMVMQPLNAEVGAGTANPSTALRVLGPEPWKVAYVEPSVRPDDSRYGLNPNRLQTHHQFQVILKPEPGNPQELYLKSLEAIGVDLHAHDVRFVEDNWASPALGAWGLGWEVWLDGMEITQFTYFQQLGGLNLSPIPVEITYGLERILMALQGVDHFKDIEYSDGVSYGEIFGQSEYEMSRYYLDDADIETSRALFDAYALEARRLVENRLPVPAYSFALKCSHAFNILDARGAVSTTERTKAFSLMRNLVRDCARLWVEIRDELDHPLGVAQAPEALSRPDAPTVSPDAAPADVLFEIGLEELPASEVPAITVTVRELLTTAFASTRLAFDDLRVDSTPRRVVVRISGVPAVESELEHVARGPRWTAAFDEAGAPTNALNGFLRKNGAAVEEIVEVDVNGVRHVAVTRTLPGRPVTEVLSTVFEQVVGGLRADKNIRWSDPELSYARPIRWLLALWGTVEIPLAVSQVTSARTTRVLRTSEPPVREVTSLEDFDSILRDEHIILDRDARRGLIVDAAEKLAASVGGTIDIEGDAGLIDEITDLVEAPGPLLGSFSAEYLEVPSSVLTTVMKKHQRYLPIWVDGALSNSFIIVANGPFDEAVVRGGNENVLRARFEDAKFFWRADLEKTPEQFRLMLDKLLVEDRLGSFLDRSRRIEALASEFAEIADLDAEAATVVRSAGAVAKFDLASQLVIEFSGLAGTMAKEYAARAGYDEATSTAIEEMERPRFSGAALPETVPGAVLSLADRFDLLTGLTTVGISSTGSSDPFGIRRIAGGIIAVLRSRPELGISIAEGISHAASGLAVQGLEVSDAVRAAVLDVLGKRYSQQLTSEGHEIAVVRAALPLVDSPSAADHAIEAIESWLGSENFTAEFEALLRVVNITPADVAGEIADGGSAEDAAFAAEVRRFDDALAGSAGIDTFLTALRDLAPHIDRFFGEVRVLDDDPQVRRARLGLLGVIAGHARTQADWAELKPLVP
ncbi:glycine--tRNA ligase [Microbacterium sp. ANT_H45B]|uniref:glycine--tRNA ligase n=1 Tax=Microbacterium sp. ANT_H45B TaxID=2597346 RepID=UPI001CAA8773|nr:glycine--tRNA ligase [Microbacterium sp. ANT_H45B]